MGYILFGRKQEPIELWGIMPYGRKQEPIEPWGIMPCGRKPSFQHTGIMEAHHDTIW
jgi:hypothetical protein